MTDLFRDKHTYWFGKQLLVAYIQVVCFAPRRQKLDLFYGSPKVISNSNRIRWRKEDENQTPLFYHSLFLSLAHIRYNKPNSAYFSNLMYVKFYTSGEKKNNKHPKQIVAYRAKPLPFWDHCLLNSKLSDILQIDK